MSTKDKLYLNIENKEFYEKNGYVILKNIFTTIEANTFNSKIRRHANKDFAALINPDRYDSLFEQDERPKSDLTIDEIKDTSSIARLIMTDKRMVDILDFFHEKKSVGLSSQFIFKEAHSNYCLQAWKPHQDNFYPKSKNAAYVTLNWFLKDADKENGTIFCYPGSHKLGLLPAKDNISFKNGSQNKVNKPLGYMIENKILLQQLIKAVIKESRIKKFDSTVLSFYRKKESVEVKLASKKILQCKLIIGADGKNSLIRKLADIGFSKKDYKQKAFIFNIKHEKKHNNLAVENFLEQGPLAALPLIKNKNTYFSSIVWSCNKPYYNRILGIHND